MRVQSQSVLKFVVPVLVAPVPPLQPAGHETGTSALAAGPVVASVEPGFREHFQLATLAAAHPRKVKQCTALPCLHALWMAADQAALNAVGRTRCGPGPARPCVALCAAHAQPAAGLVRTPQSAQVEYML
jgi:hypothetical protein